MSHTFAITMGSEVLSSDGVCGELTSAVVDPSTVSLTHLVVVPTFHLEMAARLVPMDLVEPTQSGIRLRCTSVEFGALGPVDERKFVPGAPGQWSHREDQMLFSLPYYSMSQTGLRVPMGMGLPKDRPTYVDSRMPKGAFQVHRGEHVHASDGPIGRVKGLLVDARDDHLTHVFLDEGHLWGRKRVAIPISAVSDIEHGIHVELTKDEVRDLPIVEVADPH